jgi:hypothetical protein
LARKDLTNRFDLVIISEARGVMAASAEPAGIIHQAFAKGASGSKVALEQAAMSVLNSNN